MAFTETTIDLALDLGELKAPKIALMGGVYSNYLALEAACQNAIQRGATQLFCLGDMGAFGPHPDRVFPILKKYQVTCLQGNYDDSVGNAKADCQCGYLDERDNYFARISYDYTLTNTSVANRAWLRSLPTALRMTWFGKRVLLCHGSPRQTNEFLWDSTSSTAFLEYLAYAYQADLIACTHTGLHWKRELSQGRQFVNVGALGRPANDGQTDVWYTLVSQEGEGKVAIDFIPVQYDYRRLADEMLQERLPAEFVETVLFGWWTSCLEVLPAKERLRGKY